MTKRYVKAIAIFLVIATIFSMSIVFVGCSSKDETPTISTSEPDLDYSEDIVYDMPQVMAFSAQTLVAAQSAGKTVDIKIKATVIPSDAANTLVDFSIAWGAAPTHGKEAVTDYVTVKQDTEGGLTATVSCKKAFDSDKIIITVTTRDGGFTATCTVSFVGVANTMGISCDGLTPISDSNRGIHYQLGANRTYTFNINLDNTFNSVGSKNLTVTLGGSGSLYFGKTFSDATSGMSYFSEMKKRNMSEMVDRFITSATISGTTLTVKTGKKLVDEYYSYSEGDEYGIGTYTYDRYVFYDEFELGLVGGASASDDYAGNSEYNRKNLPSCYFTITVKETVSGLSETFRVWVVTSVERVTLDKSTITI